MQRRGKDGRYTQYDQPIVSINYTSRKESIAFTFSDKAFQLLDTNEILINTNDLIIKKPDIDSYKRNTIYSNHGYHRTRINTSLVKDIDELLGHYLLEEDKENEEFYLTKI